MLVVCQHITDAGNKPIFFEMYFLLGKNANIPIKVLQTILMQINTAASGHTLKLGKYFDNNMMVKANAKEYKINVSH